LKGHGFSAAPSEARKDAGFRDCVRTIIERKRWSKHHQNSSRVAAGYESPARKCRVKWNKCESRGDDTRSHALSLAPRGKSLIDYRSSRPLSPLYPSCSVGCGPLRNLQLQLPQNLRQGAQQRVASLIQFQRGFLQECARSILLQPHRVLL
jgi:hypothetical protein